MTHPLDLIATPALLLDVDVLERNLGRMRAHLRALGVPLRPHFKTAKSIEVIRRALAGEPGGVTVSTLEEAEACLDGGIADILYAVGLVPSKVNRIAGLVRRGARMTVILDSVEAARGVANAAAVEDVVLPVLVELDVDGHRAGVDPGSPELLEIAELLERLPGVTLGGVLTHAGESYACRGRPALEAMAERERAGAVMAAERLRAAGHRCEVVSVGSTPTAVAARSLEGVSEVRAGVYMFNDLMMAGLGVCDEADIALSVLVSVIGHQPAKGWVITDGGWTALSRDRSTAALPVDQGYGVVRSATGEPLADHLIVSKVSQEHGIVSRRDGGPVDPARYPIGALLRVLPNHACATAGEYEGYWAFSRSGVRTFGRSDVLGEGGWGAATHTMKKGGSKATLLHRILLPHVLFPH